MERKKRKGRRKEPTEPEAGPSYPPWSGKSLTSLPALTESESDGTTENHPPEASDTEQ